MGVGWNRTAVVSGARDTGSGVVYLYSEHYQGQGEPASQRPRFTASPLVGSGEGHLDDGSQEMNKPMLRHDHLLQ